MQTYLSKQDFQHSNLPVTGILLTNLGTPDAPTPAALRRYLGEFLSDPRITELPRWFWLPILHGIILNIRPRRSAKLYAEVWHEEGSPLLHISRSQTAALQQIFAEEYAAPVHIALGMRYGNPSLRQGLETLRAAGARRLLILPLYPQYASATTASTFDAISDVLKTWRWLPDLHFITHYHDYPLYIQALAESVMASWAQQGKPQKTLFSFHGIPKRFFLAGDPYHCECYKTARLVAEKLNLAESEWQVTFQSRFGREEWLQPYTDHVLQALPKQGVKHVNVICAGFSADCLETLHEIDIENRHVFIEAGGSNFHYIPALNAQPSHIKALFSLLKTHLQGWEACQLSREALQQQADITVQLAAQKQANV